jgi:polar amino acid transport system substrate-binding protein
MKKIILILIAGIALSGFASADIIISGHPDWSPVMYQSGEKIVGIGPELALSILDDIGINASSNYYGSWANVQELGKKGNIDIIVAAYKTEEREKYFIYSEKYFDDPIGLFSIDNFNYTNKEDLIGHSIAVTKGDSYGTELDEFLCLSSEKGYLILNEYTNVSDAFYSLKTKESDVVLYSLFAGKKFIAADNKFKDIKETIICSQPFYMMISKKSKYVEIVPLINNFINLYRNNGKLDGIIQRAEKDAGF